MILKLNQFKMIMGGLKLICFFYFLGSAESFCDGDHSKWIYHSQVDVCLWLNPQFLVMIGGWYHLSIVGVLLGHWMLP